MQHIDLNFFVSMGASLHAFRAMGRQEQITLIDASGALFDLESSLEKLLDGNPIRLETALSPARELVSGVRDIIRRHYYAPDSNGEIDMAKRWDAEVIAGWEFSMLTARVDAFQHVLAAEFQNSATFYVPQRMGYHTSTLILNASVCAGLHDVQRFQGVARHDYDEAGKCLAFGMPTAAGFHATRAVEAVLLDYHEAFTGKRSERLMMGKAIDSLEKFAEISHSNPLYPNKKVLRTLREIKDLDRNPLAHPDATLDLIEAKALFDLAGIAIMSMLRDIDLLERAKVAAAANT